MMKQKKEAAEKHNGFLKELGLPLWVLWLPILLGVLMSAIVVLVSLLRGSRTAPGKEG